MTYCRWSTLYSAWWLINIICVLTGWLALGRLTLLGEIDPRRLGVGIRIAVSRHSVWCRQDVIGPWSRAERWMWWEMVRLQIHLESRINKVSCLTRYVWEEEESQGWLPGFCPQQIVVYQKGGRLCVKQLLLLKIRNSVFRHIKWCIPCSSKWHWVGRYCLCFRAKQASSEKVQTTRKADLPRERDHQIERSLLAFGSYNYSLKE